MNTLHRLTGGVERFFTLWVLAGAAAGWWYPAAFAWVKPNISLLLGVVMFGMGMTLTAADFRTVLRRPHEMFIGVLCQYAIMPALGYLLARALALPPELAVGVILVGTCPGGTASNVVTYLARGDVPLSVCMTTCSTLLAPLATPALTYLLASRWIPVNAAQLFLDILTIVIVPLALGVAVHRLFGRRVERVQALLPVVSVAAIVLIVAYIIGAAAARIREAVLPIFGAVMLHNFAGLALGYTVARLLGLSVPKQRAVSIEVGMQNSGLAVALAVAHFSPLSAVPGAVFSLWHNLTGSALASWWAARTPRTTGSGIDREVREAETESLHLKRKGRSE